jgi:hypothetical protein
LQVDLHRVIGVLAILPTQAMRPTAHGLRSWQWLTLIKVGQVTSG